MTRVNGKKRGFTLVELLVVICMIGLLLGAITTSVGAAQKRARVQKATSDVKVITQAILSYENFRQGDLQQMNRVPADSSSLGFLLGKGETSDSSTEIPALLQTALSGGGKILDPWGHPYLVTIRKVSKSVSISTASGNMQMKYSMPNFYRLGPEERGL